MPRYDHRCLSCGSTWEAFARAGSHPSCPCGGATEYVWRAAPSVNGDECDFVTEHGFKEPRRFRSRAEWKQAMKEAGIRPYDKFTPMPGTDRPRQGGITKSLPPMDPEYLAWLADRMATGKAQKEPELTLNVRRDIHELTKAEWEQYSNV